MFDNRTYRSLHQKDGLVSFDITVKETNLNIQADVDLNHEAVKAVLDCRNTIESYIELNPEFATSMVPLQDIETRQKTESAIRPPLIQDMITASNKARVGPMAAVAGMIAQYTGTILLKHSNEILVENGGDIFVKSDSDTVFTIFAGDSPFSMTCGIEIKKQPHPFGICTSSGTLGHSKSYGQSDAAMVYSNSCPFADAMATAIGNRVQRPGDIQKAIDWGKTVEGVKGIVVILSHHIGVWGEDLKLVPL